MTSTSASVYEPLEFLASQTKVLLILLNQDITKLNVLHRLWSNAVVKVCCDGAANRLHQLNRSREEKGLEPYIPDFICGDLDSVRDEVLDHFKKKQVKVIHLPDQNATDFTKSTQFAVEYCNENGIQYDALVGFNAFGGFLDHMLSNINTLYVIEKIQTKPFYLLSEYESVCLVKAGTSFIYVSTGLEGRDRCGLIPIGCGATNVTTTGLVYNLNRDNMAFGGTPIGISTSNAIADGAEVVTIETSNYLLWTLSYRTDEVK